MIKLYNIISEQNTNIGIMNNRLGDICMKMDSVKDRLNHIEAIPARKWDKLMLVIMTAVIGGIIGYLFSTL